MVAKKLAFAGALLFKLRMLGVPRFVLLRCYAALFCPYLLFALPCWGFAAKCHVQRLAVTQNNAVRTIFGIGNRESVLEVMKAHSLLPLSLLLERQSVNLVQLLATQHIATFSGHFTRTSLHKTRGSDDTSLFVPGTASQVRQRSVFFDGVRLFNVLPRDVRAIGDARTFKKSTKAWYLAELPRLILRPHMPAWGGVRWGLR